MQLRAHSIIPRRKRTWDKLLFFLFFFLDAFIALGNPEIWCTLLRDLFQISAYYLIAEYRSHNRTP